MVYKGGGGVEKVQKTVYVVYERPLIEIGVEKVQKTVYVVYERPLIEIHSWLFLTKQID